MADAPHPAPTCLWRGLGRILGGLGGLSLRPYIQVIEVKQVLGNRGGGSGIRKNRPNPRSTKCCRCSGVLASAAETKPDAADLAPSELPRGRAILRSPIASLRLPQDDSQGRFLRMTRVDTFASRCRRRTHASLHSSEIYVDLRIRNRTPHQPSAIPRALAGTSRPHATRDRRVPQ